LESKSGPNFKISPVAGGIYPERAFKAKRHRPANFLYDFIYQ
jgi:hypothetical protein